ncbi:hypothetical protein Pelo_1253 [Pelomyxa schiedti]|nr:hypothetical protein Pelo_1253 [Pelomyxa schiedti]
MTPYIQHDDSYWTIEPRAQAMAILAGLHPRCGRRSPVRSLSPVPHVVADSICKIWALRVSRCVAIGADYASCPASVPSSPTAVEPMSATVIVGVSATLGTVGKDTWIVNSQEILGWMDWATCMIALPFGVVRATGFKSGKVEHLHSRGGAQFGGFALNGRWRVLWCGKSGELLVWKGADYGAAVRVDGEPFKWLEFTGADEVTVCQRDEGQWMLVQIDLESSCNTKELCKSSKPAQLIAHKPRPGIMGTEGGLLVPVEICDESSDKKSYSLWSTGYNSTVPLVSQWPIRKLDDHRFMEVEPRPGNAGLLFSLYNTGCLSQPYKRFRVDRGSKFAVAPNGFIVVWALGKTKVYDAATALPIIVTRDLQGLPARASLSLSTVPPGGPSYFSTTQPQQHTNNKSNH